MRLFGMYFLCKEYTEYVQNMIFEIRQSGSNTTKIMTDWQEKSSIINKISQVDPVRENARTLYSIIPAIFQDMNRFDVSDATAIKFEVAKNELLVAMQTVIKLYENINTSKLAEETVGFDIKLPQFSDIGDFSKCLEDLDFVIKQCPYLNDKDTQIKYGSVDVGSTWLTFLIAGTMGTTLLLNLSKLVGQAVKIKSHATTVKMQEEALNSLKLKTELKSEMVNVFKQTNKVLTDKCVLELQNELKKLNDGEEEDKTGRCLEKLAFWMDKGMQIYSTIDAGDEVKDLFPAQENLSYLTDGLQKLIEMNTEKQ